MFFHFNGVKTIKYFTFHREYHHFLLGYDKNLLENLLLVPLEALPLKRLSLIISLPVFKDAVAFSALYILQ